MHARSIVTVGAALAWMACAGMARADLTEAYLDQFGTKHFVEEFDFASGLGGNSMVLTNGIGAGWHATWRGYGAMARGLARANDGGWPPSVVPPDCSAGLLSGSAPNCTAAAFLTNSVPTNGFLTLEFKWYPSYSGANMGGQVFMLGHGGYLDGDVLKTTQEDGGGMYPDIGLWMKGTSDGAGHHYGDFQLRIFHEGQYWDAPPPNIIYASSDVGASPAYTNDGTTYKVRMHLDLDNDNVWAQYAAYDTNSSSYGAWQEITDGWQAVPGKDFSATGLNFIMTEFHDYWAGVAADDIAVYRNHALTPAVHYLDQFGEQFFVEEFDFAGGNGSGVIALTNGIGAGWHQSWIAGVGHASGLAMHNDGTYGTPPDCTPGLLRASTGYASALFTDSAPPDGLLNFEFKFYPTKAASNMQGQLFLLGHGGYLDGDVVKTTQANAHGMYPDIGVWMLGTSDGLGHHYGDFQVRIIHDGYWWKDTAPNVIYSSTNYVPRPAYTNDGATYKVRLQLDLDNDNVWGQFTRYDTNTSSYAAWQEITGGWRPAAGKDFSANRLNFIMAFFHDGWISAAADDIFIYDPIPPPPQGTVTTIH